MAQLIDGKAVAAQVREEVRAGVADLVAKYGRPPGLQVILVGEDPASQVYVRNKEKAAHEVGFNGGVLRMPATASEAEVLAEVHRCNRDPEIDGILVQLPLPKQVHEAAILEAIEPRKDVDGFHPHNVGELWTRVAGAAQDPGLVPCTPRGCLRLLQSAGVKLEGANAVVVGRSNIVGKPMAALLLMQSATVTVAHSRTRDLAALCRSADILVAAIGKAKFIGADFVKPGATVIDVGMNRDEQGKLCGDVDFAAVEPIAGAITPVPGGVGPMTIAMLLDNTLNAARARLSARH